jgi:hypothetical protein
LQTSMWGHIETTQTNASIFVGATPMERAVSKGYSGDVGEALVGRLTSFQGGGLRGLGGLTTAAYHLADLFRPYGDIGLVVAQAGTSNIFSGNVTLGIQYGYSRKTAATGVQTYPCNGASVLETKTYATELPNPIPNRDAGLVPLGHPLYIRGSESGQLILSLVEVKHNNQSQALDLTMLTFANDPNKVLRPWEAVAIPLNSLQPNSTYHVRILGSDNGQSFERRFSFGTSAF